MELKNVVIFNKKFVEGLENISKLSLPVKTAISVAKLIKNIHKESEIIYDVRDKIFKEYELIKWQDGSPILKDPSKKPLFTKKMNDLLNQTFEIPLDKKISLEDISGKIEPNILLTLEPILNLEV